jgi:hypothetical protein
VRAARGPGARCPGARGGCAGRAVSAALAGRGAGAAAHRLREPAAQRHDPCRATRGVSSFARASSEGGGGAVPGSPGGVPGSCGEFQRAGRGWRGRNRSTWLEVCQVMIRFGLEQMPVVLRNRSRAKPASPVTKARCEVGAAVLALCWRPKTPNSLFELRARNEPTVTGTSKRREVRAVREVLSANIARASTFCEYPEVARACRLQHRARAGCGVRLPAASALRSPKLT